MISYTHPSVFNGIADGASWADPELDPPRIDWPARQARAAIPFTVVDGRPVSPLPPTGIRYGRNELGHWGEQVCADALVFAVQADAPRRWLLMVERSDGHGWALPGGTVDPGEDPAAAAVRELAEETGLILNDAAWTALPARGVPDPRASDEAWMVTVPALTTAVVDGPADLPAVNGADDAARAAWIRADHLGALQTHLAELGGTLFPAHRDLLTDALGTREDEPDPICEVGEKVADFLRSLPDVDTIYRTSCQEHYDIKLRCGTELTLVVEPLDVAARDARNTRTY